jgi:hypothetical protein
MCSHSPGPIVSSLAASLSAFTAPLSLPSYTPRSHCTPSSDGTISPNSLLSRSTSSLTVGSTEVNPM